MCLSGSRSLVWVRQRPEANLIPRNVNLRTEVTHLADLPWAVSTRGRVGLRKWWWCGRGNETLPRRMM